MKKIHTLLLLIILITLTAPLTTSSQNQQIKIAIRENPKYFNIIIADPTTIQHIKTYLENTTNYQTAKQEILTTTLKTIVKNPSILIPKDILFTENSIILEYEFNPKYTYDSNTRTVLPQITLKQPLPVTITENFIHQCTQQTNEKCKYILQTNTKTSTITNTIPKLTYNKSKLNMNTNNIYIFIDSTGNTLTLYPTKFNLQIKGNCTTKQIQSKTENYTMTTCTNLTYINFSNLPLKEYKTYITYNKDNTAIFKINTLTYKIITYIRPNTKIQKETVEANQLSILYFEKIKGNPNQNLIQKLTQITSKGTKIITITLTIIITTIITIGYYTQKKKKEEELI